MGFRTYRWSPPTKGRIFLLRTGKFAFVNPRRYGAMTFYDYACYRLSIFTREEANAIVAYLTCKRDGDPDGVDTAGIDAALNAFWLERAHTAPVAASLQQHLMEQDEYLNAIRADRDL